MNLEQLAAKPQLIEIKITDENLVKKYGEELVFYVYDRHDIETFAKMAAVNPEDFASASAVVKDLILDKNAKPICKGDTVLPTDVMMKAVALTIEELGKLVNTVSEKETQS